MKRSIGALLVVCCSLLWAAESKAARNFPLRGDNELSGGIGFAAAITDWTPGGFKWFNDYGHRFSDLVWLNLQLNVTAGTWDNCWVDNRGVQHCSWDHYYGHHWGGSALELAGGVKLKWRVRTIPLQIHAKLGGALPIIFFPGDTRGVAIAFRGGAGVRYFFVPTFGLGVELVNTLGPAFLNNNIGAEFFASIDFNIGIEWRF